MTTSPARHPRLRRPAAWALAAGAVLALVAALVFEPWKLVVDDRVDEPVPAAPASPPGTPADKHALPQGPGVLATGTLISHEHDSSGSVAILRLADGSRVLRLQDLRTSNGPALRIWLTDARVIAGSAGWRVFDDGRHVDLGELKGNLGNSNYAIPPEVDLAGLTSVSIWCARFHVSFAAAALESPPS